MSEILKEKVFILEEGDKIDGSDLESLIIEVASNTHFIAPAMSGITESMDAAHLLSYSIQPAFDAKKVVDDILIHRFTLLVLKRLLEAKVNLSQKNRLWIDAVINGQIDGIPTPISDIVEAVGDQLESILEQDTRRQMN